MAAEPSRSNSTADSYIGSLISLTSKSEMRYEGVLYNINTEESSIGLSNVRSFGTEGRKKDGPQVPPSDKVFEYILFRGSDIKDLQVKSSPPIQTTPPINNDPAIIQSHYSRPAPTSISLSTPTTGSSTETSSHPAPLGLPGSNFQGGMPLYQSGGSIGAWGPSPLPNANGSGLPMPMYWQGFYGPPNGLPPHLQQQSLLRPPPGPGLSMPPSMQQPMQYPGLNASLPTGTSNFPTSNLLETPSPLLPFGSTVNMSSTSLAPVNLPSALPSTLSPLPAASLASQTLPSSLPVKAPSSALATAALSGSLPSLSPLMISGSDMTVTVPSISNKTNSSSGPTMPYQAVSQSVSSVVGSSNPSFSEAPAPSLVTPSQLLKPAPAPIQSSPPSQIAHKDVEVVQVASASLATATTEAQPPILPLPTPSRNFQKSNGVPFQHRNGYRGRERGRGRGVSRPMEKFTEDFDFMAMNEKFKKDEVWGHLGKSKKAHSEDKDEDGKLSDEDDFEEEADTDLSKLEVKAIYNKDDFFDSLSCNALDHDSNSGRPRFSEQRKIDTETFGEFSRYRGGRGGRGPGRGGRFRGSYYGRGYGGYVGRGRGRGMPSRAT